MSDPAFLLKRKTRHDRRGAVIPMFAILLPVLLILCGFAINMAYMQLVYTEMKVATDVSSHAGGRAMSEAQRELSANMSGVQRRAAIVQRTYDAIEDASKWNSVGGKALNIRLDDRDVHFGYSTRPNNGMYQFTKVPVAQIKAGTERASSVGVKGKLNIPLVFQTMNISKFKPKRRSIATQVDRDIALVIDRSGSMLNYKDDKALDDALTDLYEDKERKRRRIYWRGRWYYQYYYERRISYDDMREGQGYYDWYGSTNKSVYKRYYSSDVRNEMYDLYQRTNDTKYRDMYEHMVDWENYRTSSTSFWPKFSQAARHSRWSFLVEGVGAFLDVLGGTTDGTQSGTDQKELVSLVTFQSTARVDVALTDDDIYNGGIAYYQTVRDAVADIAPWGGTGIGGGMATGLPPIVDPDWAQNNNMSGAAARPFAEKTIVVMTDGRETSGTDPVGTVKNIVANNAVTIHTVTFTPGAEQGPMKQVAKEGGGKAYHADTGEVLVEIFEEIANNLPTILTE